MIIPVPMDDDLDRRCREFLSNICDMHEQAEREGDIVRMYWLGWALVALTGDASLVDANRRVGRTRRVGRRKRRR